MYKIVAQQLFRGAVQALSTFNPERPEFKGACYAISAARVNDKWLNEQELLALQQAHEEHCETVSNTNGFPNQYLPDQYLDEWHLVEQVGQPKYDNYFTFQPQLLEAAKKEHFAELMSNVAREQVSQKQNFIIAQLHVKQSSEGFEKWIDCFSVQYENGQWTILYPIGDKHEEHPLSEETIFTEIADYCIDYANKQACMLGGAQAITYQPR